MPRTATSFRQRLRDGLRAGLLAVLVLCAASVHALDPRLPLGQFVLEKWGADDGLPQNSVNAFAHAADGFLWIATYEGLAQFDGLRIHPATESITQQTGSALVRLWQGSDDSLWVASVDRGLTRLKDGQFTHWNTASGLPSDTVMMVRGRTDSDIWVGTQTGLARIVDDKVVLVNGIPATAIRDVYFDAEQRVWVLTRSSGLFVIDADGVAPVALQGDNTPIGGSITGHADGGVWVATMRGLHHIDSRGRWQRRLGIEDGLAGEVINKLLLDRQGALWIGYEGKGLQRLYAGKLDSLPSDGLPNNFVSTLFEDRFGNVWIGTNLGLARLRESLFINFGEAEGMPGDYARVIAAAPDGSLWAGVDGGGLVQFSQDRIAKIYSPANGLLGDSVRALAFDAQGGLWIGNYTVGLQHLVDGAFRNITPADGLPSTLIRAIQPDREGVLWLGTEDRGLIRYDGLQFERIDWEDGSASVEARSLLLTRDGRLWTGTYERGVGVFDPATRRLQRIAAIPPTQRVLTLFEDRERRIWVGGQAGLGLYLQGQFRNLANQGAAFQRAVFYINDDAEGGLWFTGNLGLSHVSAEALAAWIADPAQPLAATRLDRLDGLRSSQLNGTSQPAGARDAEGRLWLPSARGVAVLRDDSTILAERPPSVQLEAVLIDGIVTPLAPRAAITLPPTGGRIEFRFSGVNSLLPRAPLYQTRMEGLDSDWSAPESRQSVTYGALNAGDYVFRVRSVAPGGTVSTEIRVPVQVLPMLWDQPWVRVLAILLTLIGIYAFAQWRWLRLRAINRRLEAEVDARTRELRSNNVQLEEALVQVQELSRTDTLTGLGNRRFLQDEIHAEMALTLRVQHEQLALAEHAREGLVFLLLDLDHFKRINDEHGHAAGDRWLAAVADTIRQTTRSADHRIRWGGEEFLVMLRLTRADDAMAQADRLLQAIRGLRVAIDDQTRLQGTASIGIASWPIGTGDRVDWEAALQLADAALYQAKHIGRDQACMLTYAPRPVRLHDLQDALRHPAQAIADGRFQLTQRGGETPLPSPPLS
jgi:diguanylate cyclase (GGDEF)-like protein